MAQFDDNAFRKGWKKGWEAAKVLGWIPLHELEASTNTMRRAGDYESCGYWCGWESSQKYFNSLGRAAENTLLDSGAGILVSY